jgi:hypothetical protein
MYRMFFCLAVCLGAAGLCAAETQEEPPIPGTSVQKAAAPAPACQACEAAGYDANGRKLRNGGCVDGCNCFFSPRNPCSCESCVNCGKGRLSASRPPAVQPKPAVCGPGGCSSRGPVRPWPWPRPLPALMETMLLPLLTAGWPELFDAVLRAIHDQGLATVEVVFGFWIVIVALRSARDAIQSVWNYFKPMGEEVAQSVSQWFRAMTEGQLAHTNPNSPTPSSGWIRER